MRGGADSESGSSSGQPLSQSLCPAYYCTPVDGDDYSTYWMGTVGRVLIRQPTAALPFAYGSLDESATLHALVGDGLLLAYVRMALWASDLSRTGMITTECSAILSNASLSAALPSCIPADCYESVFTAKIGGPHEKPDEEREHARATVLEAVVSLVWSSLPVGDADRALRALSSHLIRRRLMAPASGPPVPALGHKKNSIQRINEHCQGLRPQVTAQWVFADTPAGAHFQVALTVPGPDGQPIVKHGSGPNKNAAKRVAAEEMIYALGLPAPDPTELYVDPDTFTLSLTTPPLNGYIPCVTPRREESPPA